MRKCGDYYDKKVGWVRRWKTLPTVHKIAMLCTCWGSTTKPDLKDHAIGHKNVVCQDRWPLVTGSVILKYTCRSFRRNGLSRQMVSHDSGLSIQVSLYRELLNFTMLIDMKKLMKPTSEANTVSDLSRSFEARCKE